MPEDKPLPPAVKEVKGAVKSPEKVEETGKSNTQQAMQGIGRTLDMNNEDIPKHHDTSV